MDANTITPLAAFDVDADRVDPVGDDWPELQGGGRYRWLHLDIGEPGTSPWTKEHLPAIAARALLQPETRPRCERLGDGIILNLRGVNLNPGSNPEDMVSLRLWVTSDSIVSGRRRKVFAVDAMRVAATEGKAPRTVGAFLAELAHQLTNRIEAASLELEEETDTVEEQVSEGHAFDTAQLTRLRNAVIKMRRFINPQREALATLMSMDDWIIAKDELDLLRESGNRTRRIVEELDATRDRLSALQEHLDAERAHAIGRNSYVLSVVAAIFLPLGFLTGLFGVNVAGMPGVDSPAAFWVLTGVMAIVGIALFLIFKLAKWL